MGLIIHDLTYGNVSANDYGIRINSGGIYNAPKRNIELVEVPGRNGSLTIDRGSYDNITVEYPCFCHADTQEEFARKLNSFRNAMVAQIGYQKLVDTYNPDEYRLALYVEGLEVDQADINTIGDFTLKFNCKPQRYLISGDNEVTITNGSTLNNPTLYDSEPLLKIEGYGDIGFNGYNINIENATMGRMTVINKGSGTLSFASVSSGSITKAFNNQSFNVADTIRGTMTITATCKTGDSMTDIYDIVNDVEDVTYTVKPYTTRKLSANLSVDVGMVLTVTLPFGYGIRKDDTELSWANNLQLVSQLDSSDIALALQMAVGYLHGDTLSYGVTIVNPGLGDFDTNIIVDYSDVIGDSTLSILGNPTYIDCEIGEAYKYEGDSLIGLNSYIDLGSDLPKLSKGINTFEVDDTITSLTLIPRWWQL